MNMLYCKYTSICLNIFFFLLFNFVCKLLKEKVIICLFNMNFNKNFN